MIPDKRMVVQSPVFQGETEIITYVVDLSNWGNSPSGGTCKVWFGSTGSWGDVTSTIMPSGSVTFNGNFMSLPPARSVQELHGYHVIATFTINSNTLSTWFDIIGEK